MKLQSITTSQKVGIATFLGTVAMAAVQLAGKFHIPPGYYTVLSEAASAVILICRSVASQNSGVDSPAPAQAESQDGAKG
jgi:hypothetical protein